MDPKPSAWGSEDAAVSAGGSTPHGVELPILGIPVRFRSNDARVIRVVDQAFGAWPGRTSPADAGAEPDVGVTLLVLDPSECDGAGAERGGGTPRPRLHYRYLDRERVLLHGPGSVGLGDAERREAAAWVTPALVRTGHHFRAGVVEALTLQVLSHLDRTPFHAAALVRDGRAILLAGPSGAGKSTLSYSAVRAGHRLLAEDHVNVQLAPGPGFRVWGLSRFIHLPPEARTHFPELEGVEPALVHGGKEKLAVDVAALDGLPDRPFADDAALCVVEGGSADSPRLDPLDADALASALPWGAEPGFDVFRDEIAEAVERLARPGGWRLTLGGHPDDAVPLLDRIFAEMEEADQG